MPAYIFLWNLKCDTFTPPNTVIHTAWQIFFYVLHPLKMCAIKIFHTLYFVGLNISSLQAFPVCSTIYFHQLIRLLIVPSLLLPSMSYKDQILQASFTSCVPKISTVFFILSIPFVYMFLKTPSLFTYDIHCILSILKAEKFF